jgi:hypothetical protein
MDGSETAVLRPGGRDYLVPFPVAASTLGRTTDTLDAWEAKGLVPAVELEGGRKSTYASWLAAVMASAKPGRRGVMADVTAAWWAAHPGLKAAA